MSPRFRRVLQRCLAAFALLLSFPMALAADDIWVLVDTKTQVLSVMQEDREVERLEHIAIGRGGASADRQRGDGRTPLGTYRVAWINEDSPFRRFYGIDFPSPVDARRAFEAGKIGEPDLKRIEAAAAAGRVPPQNTPLGGRLGIHGLGGGSLRIHRDFNWTQGCIALTNPQIDRLSQWMVLGTRVVVR